MTSNTPRIDSRSSSALKLILIRAFIAICLFILLLSLTTSILLCFLMPNVVFNAVLRPATYVILATISVIFSFRLLKQDILIRLLTKKPNTKKPRLYYLLLFVVMLAVFGGLLGGRLLYIQIQSAFDKRWCENHSIEFNIIKHDEIEEYRVDRSVRRIQESLESFRNQYPINTSGTPLKELHLYANHDSFIAQTGSDNNTAAFFSLRSGVPGIYMPANLYFMQPEAILHEAMHSYVYEIFGESYGEIPLCAPRWLCTVPIHELV